MGFENEQKGILDLSDELDKIHGRSWAHYKGDLINRKIISLINPHLAESNCEGVGPSVYVENCPTEFDALVVGRGAIPDPRSNFYKFSDVKVLIEVKKHGVYFEKSEGEYRIDRYFKQFKEVKKPFVYLTVKESGKFIDMTKNVLGDSFFVLCISGGSPIAGEWARFVEKILELTN